MLSIKGASSDSSRSPARPMRLDARSTRHSPSTGLFCRSGELLDRTLRGSVRVLGEVLALANPTAFGQAVRVQKFVRELAESVVGAGVGKWMSPRFSRGSPA